MKGGKKTPHDKDFSHVWEMNNEEANKVGCKNCFDESKVIYQSNLEGKEPYFGQGKVSFSIAPQLAL